jgi:hypothetical protein
MAVAAGWIDGNPVVTLAILTGLVDGFEVGTVDVMLDFLDTDIGTQLVFLVCSAVCATEFVVISCEGFDASKSEELFTVIRHFIAYYKKVSNNLIEINKHGTQQQNRASHCENRFMS